MSIDNKWAREARINLRNEDYSAADADGFGGNLDDRQRYYNALWRQMKRFQVGSRGARPANLNFLGLGFKPAAQKGPDGQMWVQPFDTARPIRPLSSVRCVTLTPVAGRDYRGGLGRCWGVNGLEQPGRLRDGQVSFGDGNPDVREGEVQQWDFSENPLQDHAVFLQKGYDPGTVGEVLGEAMGQEPGLLKSPLSGRFTVSRDDLFINLAVSGILVFRFNQRDEAALAELDSPREVKVGDPLVRLIHKCLYRQTQTGGGRLRMDTIRGPMLPARKRDLFELCNHLLDRMLGAVEACENDELGAISLLREVAPQPLARFSEEDLAAFALREGEPSAAFKQRLLEAVSPLGRHAGPAPSPQAFLVRAPIKGTYQGCEVVDGYPTLSISPYEEPDTVTRVTLPQCAQVHPALQPGMVVSANEPLGYWARPGLYLWGELRELAGPHLNLLVRRFLDHQCIRAGTAGYQGEDVLLDPALVPEDIAGKAKDHWLDFRNGIDATDPSSGTLPLGAFRYDEAGIQTEDLAHWTRTVHGIQYVFRPVRGWLTKGQQKEKPNTGTRSRRRRRSRSR